MDDVVKQEFIRASLRYRKVDVCFPDGGSIHFGELVAMGKLADCEQTRQKMNAAEIGGALHISRPAVSQILNSLEKKGCIIRQIDPGDRRKITVLATAKGQALLEESLDGYNKALSEVFIRYGEENILELAKLMNRLADVYEQMENGD